MRGKTIKLYIMSSKHKALKTAELSNWSGKAYIGERKHVSVLKHFEETSAPGVYVLISDSHENVQSKIYIGEADDVQSRLEEHIRKKEWWDSFVLFVSKDSNLTKSHARYLEKSLYDSANKSITTIELMNKSTPTGSKLPQSDLDEMDDFIENIMFMFKNISSLKFVESTDHLEENNKVDDIIFLLSLPRKKELKAKLKIVNDNYRLLAGSCIRKDNTSSSKTHNYHKLREQLFDNNYFKEKEDHFILLRDVEFSSPSAAASIVRNLVQNGR